MDTNSKVYYKKEGNKYVPIEFYDVEGLPEGLYLLYKNTYSRGVVNTLYYTRVHEIKNVGKWCDLVRSYPDLPNIFIKNLEEFKKNQPNSSVVDTINVLFKSLADYDEDKIKFNIKSY